MQGGDFLSGAAGGFFGSLGASGFGAVAGEWANSFGGNVFFGVLSGGIGAELTGGNFWVGAVTGGIVAGFNHAMHSMDNGGKGKGKKQNGNSNNTGERDTRNYKPAPKELEGFPDAQKVPNKGRTRWKTPDGKILEWDGQHGDVEVYNKRGKHIGSANPKTGQIYKKPVGGRTIDPITIGTGTTIIIGGIKFLDWVSSRVSPIFMTPIMIQQINPEQPYQQQLSL